MLVGVLFFDDEGDRVVRDIWQALATANISTSMMDLKIAPHISLGMMKHTQDVKAVVNLLENYSKQVSPIPLNMPYYGVFTSPGHVVYLGLTVTDQLYQLHRGFCQAFKDSLDWTSLYVPDRWVPHCTLAQGLTSQEIPQALEVIQQFALPINLKVNRIALVDDKSLAIVGEYAIG